MRNPLNSTYQRKGWTLTVNNYDNWEKFKNWGYYEEANDNCEIQDT